MITTNTLAARAAINTAAAKARAYIKAMGTLANDASLTDVQVIEMSGALLQATQANLAHMFEDAERSLRAAEAEHEAVDDTLRRAGM